MQEKNMPHFYWTEAVNIAVYIMNKAHTVAVQDVTPEEKFAGNKTNLLHMKGFGCIAYVHVRDKLRIKLNPKAEKCIFIGYSLEKKGYKCYNPTTHDVRVSRDVVFDELQSWYFEVQDSTKIDVKEFVVRGNTIPKSHVLSGPQQSPSITSAWKPWSGRLQVSVNPATSTSISHKGKEKVQDSMMPELSAIFNFDGASSGFEQSLDEEFHIPIVRTLGTQRA